MTTGRIALATILCAVASAAPNFTGEWKMNAARSDWGPAPAPDTYVRTIRHDEPNIHIKTLQKGPQGEFTVELKYTTDGKVWTNTLRGQEVKGTSRWDGDKLLVDYKRDFGAGSMDVKETWTLSDGGKTLTGTLNASGDAGSFEIRIVLEKQ
jgi:hypothetical protein